MSRELHDTVGHTFTTTITGMDTVHDLIDASPQEAKEQPSRARSSTVHRTAMQ